MALKQLLLRKQLEAAKAAVEAHKETRSALTDRRAALETREANAEAALEELTAESTQEEREAVEGEVAEIEAEREAVEAAEAEYEAEQARLGQIVTDLEQEIEGLEERTASPAKKEEEKKERKKEKTMEIRKFFGMNLQERDAFFARDDVKDFLVRLREFGAQKRSITGADLLIPQVMLDVVREQTAETSKLYKHVNVQRVPGKARQNVVGAIPEAVWTEMCATLNELSIVFNNVEVDGYKVGGFIPVCNAILEDSDIALATEIISMLGKAIGIALDKAILFGTGTKMPLGILTRLEQASAPGGYPASARPWANLSATNVLSVSGKTDAALFKELVLASGAAKSKYSRGSKFWAMSDTTYTKLIANALTLNAAGAVVTGMQATMPVIGGAIETLDFIPDDVIIGGYGDLYLLAERAGTSVAQSEHYRFVEDQTVFKATARYDGRPVIAEGFVAIGLGGTKPTAASITFAVDEANEGQDD